MALLEVYQGDTKRINLVFTNDDGTRLNLSGYKLYYTAKQNYTDTAPLFSILQTGHDVPVSGVTHIDLSGTQTNHCPGDYLAGFTLISSGSGISTFETDGLRIIPSLLVL
jgi:hypothetical protein